MSLDVAAAVSNTCEQLCLHFSLQALPRPATDSQGGEKFLLLLLILNFPHLTYMLAN